MTETTPEIPRANLSYPDYLDWKRLNTVFSSMDVHTGRASLLRTATGTELVSGARVSAGFFRTLAVVPALGRDFFTGEDLPGRRRHRDPQPRGMAETVRRARRCDWPDGDPECGSPHHRRCAAARLSIRSERPGGVLDDASPGGRLRREAKLPRPSRNRPPQGRRVHPGCPRRDEDNCQPARDAVPRLEPRAGRDRGTPVRSDRWRYTSHIARAACRRGTAAANRLCERREPAAGYAPKAARGSWPSARRWGLRAGG